MDVRSKLFVCDELEFESFFISLIFFFTGRKGSSKEAKKILMDEMLCTYGMENCAVLSQKAASEECIMAAASQVPGPLASVSLHHVCDPGPPLQPPCGEIIFREAEASRTAGATAQARTVPSFSSFYPHTGALKN